MPGSRGAWVLAWLVLSSAVSAAAAGGGTGPEVRLVAPFEAQPAAARLTVLVGIANQGPGEMRDVDVQFRAAAGSGLTIIGFDGSRRIDRIDEGNTSLVGLIVATPPREGTVRMSATVDFIDEDGTHRRLDREVDLHIRPPTTDPLDVVYEPRGFVSGGASKLRLGIANPGDIMVEELEIVILPDETTTAGTSTTGGLAGISALRVLPILALPDGNRALRDQPLRPGGRLYLDVPVLVSRSAPDVAGFTVQLTYVLEGYERIQFFRFSDRVSGDVRIRLLDVREEDPGTGLEITGTLVNVGTGTAWNPLLGVTNTSGYFASERLLLEDLEPNDATTFRLPVQAFDDAGLNETVLAIEWNDELGAVHESAVEGAPERMTVIEESLGDRLRGLWPWPGAAVLAAVLIALIIGVRRWRRRRALAAERS